MTLSVKEAFGCLFWHTLSKECYRDQMHTDPEVLAPMNLAERKRQLVRDQLGEAAVRLLARQGYEETTVEQIVAAAGVSRRTFFRYFKSKEDVVVESVGHMSTAIRAALAARPERENPQAAMRAALSVAVDELTADPEKAVPLIRLLLETPALRRRYLERQSILQEEMAAVLARREGIDEGEDREDLGPALVAGVAIAAFRVALDSWARHGGDGDLNALIDEAFARTSPGAAVRKGKEKGKKG
jgi:AcrR family transcriptional regulator